MLNKSGLRPLGCAVLVEPYEPERRDGRIVIPDSAKDRGYMVEQRAIVVEVGSEAWVNESKPRAKPGDKVMITKMAGYMAKGPADGKQYRLVNDRDVFCQITQEASAKEKENG